MSVDLKCMANDCFEEFSPHTMIPRGSACILLLYFIISEIL